MNENGKKPDLVDNDETLWIAAAVAAVVFTIALLIDVPFLLAILLGLILFAVLAYILHVKLGFELPEFGKKADKATGSAPVSHPVERTVPEKPAAEVTPEAVEPTLPAPEQKSPAAKAPTAGARARPVVQPTTPLPGQADLATRKGQWRYEAQAEGSDEASEGTQPQGLAAPRNDAPDDLKRIKGVGPALEQMLHGLGYYHFDQIAAWTSAEVAWVDDNLEGFKGRVSRDEWVAQARKLASGG